MSATRPICAPGCPTTIQSALAAWRADPARELTAAEAGRNAGLAAGFTPGNDRPSGHLPRLETTNAARRTYPTLMPCY